MKNRIYRLAAVLLSCSLLFSGCGQPEDKKEVEPEVTDSSSNVKKEDPANDDENLKKITDMFNDIRE